MRPDFAYKRLPGRLIGVVRKASLWEGEDHLFSVSGTRFVETYRRFYYRDIQAIVVRRCMRFGSVGAWLLTLFAMLLATTWLRNAFLALAGKVTLGILGALALYRLVVSIFFSCRCFIQTAVSREELPSLLRRWNLEPALQRIREHIREVQGTLPEDFTLPESLQAAEPAYEAAKPTRYSLAIYLALAAFFLYLVNAAAAIYFADGPTPALNSTSMRLFSVVLTLLQGGSVTAVLLQIRNLRALRGLRNLLLAALCVTGLEIYIGSFLSSLFETKNGTTTIRVDMLSLWQGIQRTDAALSLIIGLGGLCLVLLNWQTFRRGGLSPA